MRWIVDDLGVDPFLRTALSASFSGHLEILQWIYTGDPGGFIENSNEIFEEASGHLHILQWILTLPGINITNATKNKSFKLAAFDGHLDTLRWLLTQGAEASIDAFREALKGGQLDTAKWILELLEGYIPDDMDFAKANSLKTLKWLAGFPGINPAANNNIAFIKAVRYGRLKRLKWLIQFPGVNPSTLNSVSIKNAAKYGHLDVLKWLMTFEDVNPIRQDNFALRIARKQYDKLRNETRRNAYREIIRILEHEAVIADKINNDDVDDKKLCMLIKEFSFPGMLIYSYLENAHSLYLQNLFEEKIRSHTSRC